MPLESINPATAITAVQLLTMFLSSASEGFAKKTGEKLLEKTGEVYETVKGAFRAGEYGELTLLRLSEAPDDERRQYALRDALIEKMEGEPEFAKILKRLVDEAREADTNRVIVKGDRNVTIGGNVSGPILVPEMSKFQIRSLATKVRDTIENGNSKLYLIYRSDRLSCLEASNFQAFVLGTETGRLVSALVEVVGEDRTPDVGVMKLVQLFS